jgi:hypothetical protein
MVGGLLICPCHLPLTLGLMATVLSGTAVGAFLTGHPYTAGGVVTLAWVAATWRGFRYVRSARMQEGLTANWPNPATSRRS